MQLHQTQIFRSAATVQDLSEQLPQTQISRSAVPVQILKYVKYLSSFLRLKYLA